MVSCDRHSINNLSVQVHHTKIYWKANEQNRKCKGLKSPKAGVTQGLTITHKLEQGQVYLPLPRGALLEGNSITSGGKDVPTPDGHQLAAFIPPSLVIQDCCIVDESIQFPAMKETKESQEWWGTVLGPNSQSPIPHHTLLFMLEMVTHVHSILSS